MAERGGMGIKKDYKLLNWEQNDFPISCSKCLGDSKFLRMLKKPLGAECRICTRPFTVFKWSEPVRNNRQKKTEICSTCAKINNCCQVCVHDLQFDLPIEIRNKLLGDNKIDLLMSEGNKEIFAHLANEQISEVKLPYEKLEQYLTASANVLSNAEKYLTNFGNNYPNEGSMMHDNEKLNEIKPDIRIDNNIAEIKEMAHKEQEVVVDSSNIRRFVYDKYLHLNDSQRSIIEAIEEAKKITVSKSDSSINQIAIFYVDENEIPIVQSKIKNIFEDVKIDVRYEDKKAICSFDSHLTAKKFFKVFAKSFVIKGKMLSLDWNNENCLNNIQSKIYGVVTDKFLPISIPQSSPLRKRSEINSL